MDIKQKHFVEVLNIQYPTEKKQNHTNLPGIIINQNNNIIYLNKGTMCFFGGLIEFFAKISKIKNQSALISEIFIDASCYSLLEAEHKKEILVSYFHTLLDDIKI